MSGWEVVIVPVWQRADFTTATLHRLALADDGTPHYWIFADRGHDTAVLEAALGFGRRIGGRRVRVVRRLPHPHRGNSFNVLHAYREAVAARPTLIHLIEEDVFVGADYLTYARAAHALYPGAFAVSACRNQNLPPAADPPPDPQAVYAHPSYQSLAVSFRPAVLTTVLGHLCPAYFADPGRYCTRVFPHSTLPGGHAEQDGLLNRIRELHEDAATVYPAVPRAYHAGFHGYNRRGRPLGGGDTAGAAARLLAMTAQELNAHALTYRDHTTAALDTPRPAPARRLNWPPPP